MSALVPLPHVLYQPHRTRITDCIRCLRALLWQWQKNLDVVIQWSILMHIHGPDYDPVHSQTITFISLSQQLSIHPQSFIKICSLPFKIIVNKNVSYCKQIMCQPVWLPCKNSYHISSRAKIWLLFSYSVCAHIGGPNNFGGCWGPAPLRLRRDWPLETCSNATCAIISNLVTLGQTVWA